MTVLPARRRSRAVAHRLVLIGAFLFACHFYFAFDPAWLGPIGALLLTLGFPKP